MNDSYSRIGGTRSDFRSLISFSSSFDKEASGA